MFTFDEIHNNLIKLIERKLPEKANIAEVLMDILCMEKGAIYRRLRGDVPFSFYEVATIANKLDIAIYNLIYPDSVRIDRFELNIIEYTKMSESDYRKWDEYIGLMNLAKGDPSSELCESSNVLPMSMYSKYNSLTRFYLFKYSYLFSGTESRVSYHDLAISDRLFDVYQSYYHATKNYTHTIYIWDYMIFQYLVTDLNFFASINLITNEEILQIKADLLALVDDIEQIAIKGYFDETGNTVSFYVSEVNLDGDYSYLRCGGFDQSLVRAFILNAVISLEKSTFEKVENWINSFKKSSVLITKTGEIYRAEFLRTQRKIISEL